MLLDLDFDILIFGDGESILRDAKARLEELTETFPDSIRERPPASHQGPAPGPGLAMVRTTTGIW